MSVPAPGIERRRRRYEDAGLWDETTLFQRVEKHAAERPDALAIVDDVGNRRRTWSELYSASSATASHLADHGVRAADVVSIQLPNQFEAAVAAVAVQALGAIINPLLPGYREAELTHVFRVARPRAIFTPTTVRGFAYRPLVEAVCDAVGVDVYHVVVAPPGQAAAAEPRGGVDCSDVISGPPVDAGALVNDARSLSEVIFTSGTEAAPKAVLHTEQTANFSVRAAYRDMQLGPDDVVWMPSPVGHSTGFNYGLRMALYHGLPLVLQDRWDAGDALSLIERFGCTYTLAATTFLQDLIGRARAESRDLSSLRCFGCGGAPVPPDLVRAARDERVGVRRLYGSTEALVATWNRADSPPDKLDETDGRAIADVEIEIRDESGVPVGVGQRGEIHVRGPNTCVGFFRDDERQAKTISEDGWVRSGDLGVLDAEGYLSIVGRIKDIIIRGGLNIAPREIEDLMLRFPEIDRVAVVGVPDDRLGERCCACVVLSEGATLDLATIALRLRGEGLAVHKLPEFLETFDVLPATASGKIQKFRIQELLASKSSEVEP